MLQPGRGWVIWIIIWTTGKYLGKENKETVQGQISIIYVR